MAILDLDSISDKDSKAITLAELRRRLKEHPNDPQLKKLNKELAESLSLVTQNLNSTLISSVQGALVGYNQNIIAALGEAMRPNPALTYLISEALHPTFIQLASEMAESQRRLLETFKMPNYLFESLKTLSDQVNNQLFESIKLLSQSFAMYQTPHLFNELTKINTSWLVPGYVSTEPIKNKKEYKEALEKEAEALSEEIGNLEQNQFQIINTPYYYYKPTKTILIMCTTIAAITLLSKRGNTDIEILGDALMDFLETKGEIVGDFKKVFITANDLFSRVRDQLSKGINFERWLKITKGNFLQSKVNVLPKGLISFEYDKGRKCYCFQIRVTIPVPKILI